MYKKENQQFVELLYTDKYLVKLIYLHIFALMAIIVIDTNEWTTQQKKAETFIKKDGTTGVSIQYISKLIKKGKLKSKPIDEIGLVLVKKND